MDASDEAVNVDGQQIAIDYGAATRLSQHPMVGTAGLARLHGGGPVLIAGAGNLGHRIAVGLAPLKVPLWLVDHGRVEAVNVGVQQFAWTDVDLGKADAVRKRLLTMDPLLPVRTWNGDIRAFDLRELRSCRLVIGCLDNLRDRLRLMQTTTYVGVRYLDVAIDGTGESLYGRVSGFDPDQGTACLACGWDDSNWHEVAQEGDAAGCAALWNLRAEAPPTLALPGLSDMIAGLGTVQATRLLLGQETQRVVGREVRLNLTAGRLAETTLRPDPRCRLDHRPWTIDPQERSAGRTTIEALFAEANRAVGDDAMLSVYGDALVIQAACPMCQRLEEAASLRGGLSACEVCGNRLVPLNSGLFERFTTTNAATVNGKSWSELGLTPGRAVVAEGRAGRRAYLFGA